MRIFLNTIAIVLLALTAFHRLYGQQPEQPKKGEAEVLFANGSALRMSILQDKIDVQTRYGKLSIPLSDIKHIDFGLHLSDDMSGKVESAIKKLGSIQYAERDEGTSELVGFGANSYPVLLRAAKSDDKEVAQRADKIIATLRENIAEKDLRSREDDIINTPEFTIIGRILTTKFKGHSEYFGDVQLQIAQLRKLRPLSDPGLVRIDVDASQYGSAHDQWLDTKIQIESNTKLVIVATGIIDLYPQTPNQYTSAPKGYGNILLAIGSKLHGTPAALRNYSGALFGRIGDNPEVFYIGDRYEGILSSSGKLYLHIVQSPWNNTSTGSYNVKITSSR